MREKISLKLQKSGETLAPKRVQCMSENDGSNFVPRAPRFKVADTSQTIVTITRTEEAGSPELEACLVDVSQHGTKLRVPVNLRFEEAVHLKIQVKDSELEYHGIASVRHIRSVDDDQWVVGCAIAPPLADETFSFLATTAGKERRRFRRLNIAAEATVRKQAQAEGVSAALHNLSSGGFCFSSSDQYEVGERVKLTLEDTEGKKRVVEARIAWQIDSPDGCIAGCQFNSNESYADVCACLTEQPVVPAKNRGEAERTSNLVLAVAILAMFVPPMMTLFMQANKVSASGGARAAETITEIESDEEYLSQQLNRPSDAAPVELLPDQDLVSELAKEIQELSTDSDPAESPSAIIAAENDEEPPMREWVDNTGKFRTVARLIAVTDDHVVLLKEDGKESTVPWNRLSEIDQQFARQQQR